MIDFAQVQRAYDSMTPEDCDATLHTCTHFKCDRDTHNVDDEGYPSWCNTCDGTTCPDCDADFDGDGMCGCD
tara:strand:+ start:338 stop:553 length:216 start_codon:yes stop_codon:yes gene_type:complete